MQSWDDFRFFLAVARGGGLSAAAKELGVEPSTVHRRIGLLEEALGTRLFDRQPRGYQLTHAGTALVSSAETIENEVLASSNRLRGRDASLTGVVRIAAAEDIASFLLVDILADLRRAHPGIELELTLGNELLSLSRGEADVAVRIGSAPTDDNVVARKICDLRAALYASKDYLKRRGRPRRLSDLKGHALVSGDHNLQIFKTMMSELVHDSTEIYRTNSVAHMAIATGRGFGIAGLPCFLGSQFPELIRLFKKPLPFATPLWVLVHHEVRRAARVRTLVDHLHQRLESSRPLLEGREG